MSRRNVAAMELAVTTPSRRQFRPPYERSARRPSDYALKAWTLVARRGMTPASAARVLQTSTWRVERIVIGVGRRNAQRW
jgi:hypothetical protein